MDNPNDIGKVIKALLDASPEVEAITQGRIYPMVSLTQDMPCVVYTKQGVSPAPVKADPTYYKASVIVSAIAKSYKEMVELSGALIRALHLQGGTIVGKEVLSIIWVDAKDVFDDGAYIQDIEFEIKTE